MSSSLHLTYRRNAKAALKNIKIREDKNESILERARQDFGFFCEYVADKPPAAHHREWNRHFVTEQDSSCLTRIAGPNIDLLAPRGSSKSTCLGLFTAWAIGVHTMAKMPLQILYISYTVDIARAKSATIKNIIESKKYQEVFPKVRLLKNVTSNEYWSIDHKFADIDITGDEQFTLCAAGLKGSVTSKRSHLCVTGDTLVLTDKGQTPIKEIYVRPEKYRVAVRNSFNDQIEWSNLAAVTKRVAKGIVQIETESGDCVFATPEHPFITAEGRQKRAGDLSEGDTLVGLSNWRQDQSLFSVQQYKEKNAKDLRELSQKNRELQGEFGLSNLFFNLFSSFASSCSALIEKAGVNSLQSKMLQREIQDIARNSLQILQQTFSTNQSHGQMLFESVCGEYSFVENDGIRELKLHPWMPFRRLPKDSSTDFAKGWVHVRRLQNQGDAHITEGWKQTNKSLRASYRSQPNKQYPSKFNHIMSPVSCCTSSDQGQSWAPQSISRVKFFSDREEYVYDLEVAHQDHNFIANGLNVLNCVIDDPIKGAGDIANPDIRKAMRENWNAVIAPTMFEGGRAICLGTRFRHDDIHATTFCPSNNWTQIVIPALRNNEETGEEESYWPEMWSVEYLKERKRQAPIAFSFQYMNQVIRQNELSLAPELLIKAEIATEFDALGIGVDLSAGTKDKNDYSVFVLGGRIGDKIHIIDYRRLRVMGNLEKLDALKELLNDWSIIGKDESGLYYPTYSTCDIWSEAVQYQASLEADFKRVCLNEDGLYNLIWHPVKGFRADKLARFRGIMGMFEDRKIIFNRYRTFDAMFEELTNFGVSSHDDCVDSLVWLVTGLMRKGNLQLDY